MKKRKLLLLAGSILLILTLALPAFITACAPAPAPTAELTTLLFYHGKPGGSWYPTGIGLNGVWKTYIPNIAITNIPGGGDANAVAIAEGVADIALSDSAALGHALFGLEPYVKAFAPDELPTIASFWSDTGAWIVWKDSGIMTVADLKGKRISPSETGSGDEGVARQMLEVMGMSYDDMAKVELVPSGDALDLMKDGHVDAVYTSFDSVGDPGLTPLQLTREIRFLSVPDDVLAKMVELNPGLTIGYTEPGSYRGIDEALPQLGETLGLMARQGLSEDLVYDLTRVMVEHWESHMQPVLEALALVTPEELARPLSGTAFHPGAARYYKERGWIN